jgi:hypothetical protein
MEPLKKYRVTLYGRRVGAIGIWHTVAIWTGEATDPPHARLAALEWGYANGYEHLSTPVTEEVLP